MNLLKAMKVLSILAILFAALSCSNDDPSPVKSRDIKIEVNGNFTGVLSATYITASGGGTNESITSLPWTKSITYAPSVSSMSITVGATGGTAGQKIQIKVFAGGALISETPGVANSAGMVVVTSPAYIF